MDTAVRTSGFRMVSVLQGVVLGMYLIGGVGVLLTAAARTGDWSGLADPGLDRYDDPKEYIPPFGPDSMLNPLTWVVGFSRVGAMLGLPLAALGAAAGLLALLPTLRGADRRAATRLAVGTVACVALGLFLLTPYGGQLQTWLLD
jgi:hypothetical protein